MTQRDNSFFTSDQSKNLYDYVLKHENIINEMKSEILNLKSQFMELAMKSSINNNNTSTNSIENNNLFLNQIKRFKNEIKNELMIGINDMMNSNMKKFNQDFQNLKEEMIRNNNTNNNSQILEINNSLENINQKLLINNEEKNNLEYNILNRVKNDKIEINNTTENIIKRIDNFDMDFDRLIISLKNQFLNSANTINQLQLSKVNINDYEKQIEIINQSIEDLNNKIEYCMNNDNTQNKNNKMNKNLNMDINKKYLSNEDDIGFKQELYLFKNDLYNDLEKINLKILNELKNQADDIKMLYQETNNIELKINKNMQDNSKINSQLSSNKNILNILENPTKINSNNIIPYIDIELSKKANLDQLNFALETQAKLNEAFSSASRISRFCWDSDGTLKDEKYIKWSIQNINTALDVFRWEKNSENINILQNGVYKVVFGLIGLETKKSFGIIFNNEENIIIDSGYNNNTNNLYDNENDINNDKGNIQFMIKYIACIENTNIKAIVFNNNGNDNSNDNSEEAFLEITKII
jgi:hypothetical protein